MARTEARIFTAIWGDQDVLERSIVAQWVYFATLSHPLLSHCGVVAYAPGRYPHLAARVTPKGPAVTVKVIEEAIHDLEVARFVVIDRATAELWVRSFVQRDGVLQKPNMIKAMMREFSAILSPAIREQFIEGLGEGFLEGLAEGFPKVFPKPFRQSIPKPFLNAYLEGFQEPPGDARVRAQPPLPLPPPPPDSAVNGSVKNVGVTAGTTEEREIKISEPPPLSEEFEPLAERLATLWPNRPRMLAECRDVVNRCLSVADRTIVDEEIGKMLLVEDKPHTPRYLLASVRNRLVSMGAYTAGDEALAVLR